MEHHQEAFYQDPKFWVIVSFICFVLLAFRKISALIAKVLDDRSEKIRVELEAAKALRAEAEVVLADYKQKQAMYMQEAQAMIEKAQADAQSQATQAEKELKLAIEERTKNAMQKIAQEEATAVAEVRAHVVEIALSAARSVIVEQTDASLQEKLLSSALAEIERKVH